MAQPDTIIFLEAKRFCRYKCTWQDALACRPDKNKCPVYDFVKEII